ncbi:hypothetical protein ACJX0J_011132, partial [Zea mays]
MELRSIIRDMLPSSGIQSLKMKLLKCLKVAVSTWRDVKDNLMYMIYAFLKSSKITQVLFLLLLFDKSVRKRVK